MLQNFVQRFIYLLKINSFNHISKLVLATLGTFSQNGLHMVNVLICFKGVMNIEIRIHSSLSLMILILPVR